MYNFTIIQLLEFVKGSSGIADTVRISYKITNNGPLSQKAGVRIMLDTMLASNDDAPFKVVGYDNVTSELELRGSNVPSSYQVYDNLDNPTTIATGTLYLQNDRHPDKVQFARWDYIEDTLYNYAVGDMEFGDTAVGIYFDPVVLEASASTSVCTYYGVNSSLSSTDSNVVIENLTDTQFAVLVFDSLSQRYLSGAEVAMEGRTVTTDENGMAVFDNCKDIDGKNVTVKVKKDGYEEIEVQRQVLCGSFTGVGIVSQGYDLEEPAVLSAVLQSGSNMYDLLTTCVNYDEAKSGDNGDILNESIHIRVANAGTVNTYRLVQGGEVKYESTDGTFQIPIATKDRNGVEYKKPRIAGLSAGQDVQLQMVKTGWGVKRADLGLIIGKPTFEFGSVGAEKGSISLDDSLKFTIPGDVPIFGGFVYD